MPATFGLFCSFCPSDLITRYLNSDAMDVPSSHRTVRSESRATSGAYLHWMSQGRMEHALLAGVCPMLLRQQT
ncbi:hypothetical protein RRG08_030125 [Elysia crispata]|uniref:Uncharacterized protein n=1 Tax=Elysia crispata TaxID=231223 RepID=A0AAE1DLQ5_9GAST|nr:hypothetical protein RRG08_030125 [Elysia crispata]